MSNNNDEELDVHSYVPLICKTRTIKIKIMSNETKQTAVEWLFQETLGITLQLTNKRISHRNWELQMVKLHKQAKEMEKEQIIDALLFGDVLSINTAENYYKERFGGKK